MDLTLDPQAEHQKWLRFDTRLIFTNCGALTWYLRKAWLLDHAPELMPASDAGEAFAIRRAIRLRLSKVDHFSHVRIRARLAFAERLFHLRRSVPHPESATAGFCWNEDDQAMSTKVEPGSGTLFAPPGKPRALKVADLGHEWIYLKWKWPRSSVTRVGYRIERSSRRTTGYQPIAATHGCDLLLLPVRSRTKYYYRIRAFNPSGDGPPSESISITAF